MSGNRHDGSPETWVGKVVMFDEERDYLINQRVGALRPKGKIDIDVKFFHYVLSSWPYQKLFISVATSSGGQANISPDQILNSPVYFPVQVDDQIAISQILSSLDDKIDLLRRQNATLEAMAQTLFRSWFVDFDPVIDKALAVGRELPKALAGRVAKRRKVLAHDHYPRLPEEVMALFPNRFVFSEELGKWVPEGWEVKPLGKVGQIVGGGTPSRKVDKYFASDGEAGIPWLSPKDLSGYEWKFIGQGASDVTAVGLKNSSARIVPAGTVLFSSRAPIGYIAIASKQVSTNQGFKSLVPKNVDSNEYFYYYLKFITPDIINRSSGSTFKEISGSGMKSIDVLVPSAKCLSKFKSQVGSYSSKMLSIQNEALSLVKLRDTLLPPLISGKLSVENFTTAEGTVTD